MDALAACARAHCSADCPGPPTTPERVAECTAAFDVELADLSGDCDAQRDCACRNCNDDWLACLADPRCIAFLDCSLRVCSGVACANTSGQCGLQLTDAPFRRTRFCGEQYCGACLAGGRDN